MEYEGDLSLLCRLARGEGRIGALGLSGGNAGAEGCAQACAFESYGLTKFKVIGAISSFAGPAIYFAANMLNKGASCYWEECTTENFISFSIRRFLNGTTADVGFLVNDVFRKEVRVEAINRFPGDVVVGVTDWKTGRGHLINLKTAGHELFDAVRATMAMPVLYRKPVIVNGQRKYDGASAIPFPALELIKRWDLDGLIIFANHPKDWRPKFGARIAEIASTFGMMPNRRRASLMRISRYENGLKDLRESKRSKRGHPKRGHHIRWPRDRPKFKNRDRSGHSQLKSILN